VSDTRKKCLEFCQSELWKRRQLRLPLKEQRQQTFSKKICPAAHLPLLALKRAILGTLKHFLWLRKPFNFSILQTHSFLPSFQTLQHPPEPHSVIIKMEAGHLSSEQSFITHSKQSVLTSHPPSYRLNLS